MSILGGVDWDVVQAAMYAWTVAGSGLASGRVVWGQQDAPRPQGPAIVMRISNIAELGQPWLDWANNPLVFEGLTTATVDAAANTFAIVAHALLTGDGPVRVASSGVLPSPLLEDTDYWVIRVSDDSLSLASSFANAMSGQPATPTPIAIDILDAGSGTITLSATAETLRAGEELLAYARGFLRVTLELTCHTAASVGFDMATSILQRVRSRRLLPSQQERLANVNISCTDIDRVRAILGIRDALLFEPRSTVDCHFSVTIEDSEGVGIISHAEIENLLTHVTTTIPE